MFLYRGLVLRKFKGGSAKVHGERGAAGPLGHRLHVGCSQPRARPVGRRSPPWAASRKPPLRVARVGLSQVGPRWADLGFSFLGGDINRLLVLFLSGSLVSIIKSH